MWGFAGALESEGPSHRIAHIHMKNSDQRAKGRLVIVGGGEDRSADSVILRRFVELAGDGDARIVVICTATTEPDGLGAVYQKAFDALGVNDLTILPVGSREEANDPEVVAAVENATGVYFTGGDQLRIASIFGGSHADTALHAGFHAGLVIGGTSAGAAMMSTTMVLGGTDRVPTAGRIRTGAGLGLVSGVTIDMHFAERGRLSRLLAVTGMFPHELGLGIDEDTAAVVDGDHFEVIGSGAVTVVDAGEVTSLHIPDDDGPMAMTGVLLHILPSGYSFDLSTRRPLIVDAPDGVKDKVDGE
ncbi:MAG: cyanophycinase [Ilumatobacteraceae bacterium]|nr:cyanophycinase [Ilumatobacteraceae bacterium]